MNWEAIKAAIPAAALVALAVLLTLSMREVTHLKAQIADMERAALEADITAREWQRTKEREWQAKADEADRAAAARVADVTAHYEESIADLYEVLAAFSDSGGVPGSPDGMHADSPGGNASALPGASGASGGPCAACPDGCGGPDSGRLQVLLDRQMMLARDCDITAARYNELLRLWDALE